MPVKKVAIIMGSDSDIPAVAPAKKRLESLGIPVEAHIFSAHRTPAAAAEFSKNARTEGFGVIIAAAGKAAHLAGALAAQTTLPVIGIPIKSSTLDGLDALLSTVQMPSGIPRAVEDGGLADKLQQLKNGMCKAVAEKDRALQNKEW